MRFGSACVLALVPAIISIAMIGPIVIKKICRPENTVGSSGYQPPKLDVVVLYQTTGNVNGRNKRDSN